MRFVLLSLLLVGCASREAEAPQMTVQTGDVQDHLYPAELVLDHQEAISLTEAQRESIRTSLQESQREIVDTEIELRARRETLSTLLAATTVDEAAALEAATRVADSERAIKLTHFRLLVRIKNQLTAEQQRTLDGLRAQ